MSILSSLIRRSTPGSVLCVALLLSGCVVPGYPYNGYAPYGTVPAAPPTVAATQVAVAPAPVPVPPPGVVVGAPVPYPYVYAPAPYLIAPTFYAGFGTGYWYGNRFWPYRPGCAFYGGRYYGGYRANYWRGGNGHWQGGSYHGGGGWNR